MAGYQRFGFYTRDNEHLVGGVYRTLTGRQDAFDWGDVTADGPGTAGKPRGLLARPKAPAKDGKATLVMPDEKDLPPGWKLDTVRGLMDQQMADSIFGSLDLNSFTDTVTTKAIAQILDESRGRGRMKMRFPGSADNFAAVNEVGLPLLKERMAKKFTEPAAAIKDPKDLAGLDVLSPIVLGINARAMNPDVDLEEFYAGHPFAEDLAYTVDQVMPEINRAEKSWTVSESVSLAKEIVEKLNLPDDKDEAEQQEGEGEGEGQSDEFKKALAKAMGKDGDSKDGGEAAGSDGDAKDREAGGTATDDMLKDISKASDKAKEIMYKKLEKDLKDPKKSGMLKPIYPLDLNAARVQDVEEHIYLKPNDYRDTYNKMHQKIKRFIAPLRSALRIHLLSEARTKYKFEQEAGDLCKKSLYQVAQGTSSRVFQTMQRGKSKKTVVGILIDASGSMGGADKAQLATYEPGKAGGGRYDKAFHAAMAACALTEALRGMPGIRVEVCSFTAHDDLTCRTKSCRTQRLQHRVYKTLDKNEMAGIGAMLHRMHRSENVDGESVRWAGRRLLSATADRRILMVLSDGYPSGSVYGTPAGCDVDNDLSSAVKACEMNGIETIGIGIKTDAVRNFYPKHVVIHDTSELMGTAMRSLLNALDSKSSS